jgi:hypothetical protein
MHAVGAATGATGIAYSTSAVEMLYSQLIIHGMPN